MKQRISVEDRILNVLKRRGPPLTITELAKRMMLNRNVVRFAVKVLMGDNEIKVAVAAPGNEERGRNGRYWLLRLT